MRVWEGKPTMIEAEIEGGTVARFLLDETQLKQRGIAEGDTLEFRLRQMTLEIEK